MVFGLKIQSVKNYNNKGSNGKIRYIFMVSCQTGFLLRVPLKFEIKMENLVVVKNVFNAPFNFPLPTPSLITDRLSLLN